MEARQYQKAACKLGELVTGKFEWKPEHSEAFEELKNMLSSDTVQAYFDPQAEHELHIDGCPVGLAATLTQRKPREHIYVWAGTVTKIILCSAHQVSLYP